MTQTKGEKSLLSGSNCCHQYSHIIDSRLHGCGYGTPSSRAIFCDFCRMQRWLDIEVVLAEVQAARGIIPESAALEISRAAKLTPADVEIIRDGVLRTGHSLVPLLRLVQERCANHAGEYLHYGATTQDIQDTAQAIEIREVVDQSIIDLQILLSKLCPIAKQHRRSLMVGRSHAMPALPTTFGLKVASWIDELIRHLKRLKSMRPRIAVAQLFGGVGTMAGLGPHALDLLADFAPRLGLGIPITCWHASRDRVAEFVHVMAMLSASLARIADELRTLHREEIGEVFMHLSSSYIGSSTMPYKCNPENAEQVVTLSRLARAQVPLALEAMHVEHERDYRSTRLEWCCVADVSHYTLAALALMTKILDSLKVNTARMGERAQDFREQICAEQLVFALAPSLGKDVAYQLVDSYLRKSHEDEVPLIQLLARDARVMHILGGYKGIESSLCANSHLGSNDKLIDNVLQYALENLSSSRSHEDLLS